MFNLLFGFEGRISRGQWWLVQLFLMVLQFTGYVLLAAAPAESAPSSNGGVALLGIFLIGAAVALLWMSLAITVKRYHDLGKSGLWCLIAFVPLIGMIWQITECGCFPGDIDSNQYGPPPGAAVDAEIAAMPGPGALATKEINFSKYRVTPPVVVATATPAPMASASAGKPVFGKRG